MDIVTDHINDSVDTVVNYINNTIVSNQNDFTTSITNQQNQFQTNIETNIGGYLDNSGAGYSISQINSLMFTGSSNIILDNEGRISSCTQNNMTSDNFIYNDEDLIISFRETLSVDGIDYIKNYNVTYDSNDNPIIQEI